MANKDKRKIEIFINELQTYIAKDLLTGDNPLMTYAEIVRRVQRSEVMRLKIARKKGMLE